MGRVDGKVALITGGASGLGAADAKLLAAEGAKVVITDVNEDLGRQTAAAIGGAVFMPHDVRDEAAWKRVVASTVEHFGRLDVLVNNAGLVYFTDILNTPLEQFRLLNAVMSEGTFLGCKTAIPAMVQSGGGSIINVSSVAAIKGIGVIPSYSAAKGAIRSLTRSVAAFCQDQRNNIRCNVILPGAHDTPMTQQAQAELDAGDPGLDQTRALGQGTPQDVANLVLFLASDESRHFTGAELVIDNGETMR